MARLLLADVGQLTCDGQSILALLSSFWPTCGPGHPLYPVVVDRQRFVWHAGRPEDGNATAVHYH